MKRSAGTADLTAAQLTLFSGKFIKNFYSKTVTSHITNNDYAGEIVGKGSKLVIPTSPEVQIHDYHKGQALQVGHLDSDAVEMTVDRAKYFNFIIDDIDERRNYLPMVDQAMNVAAARQKTIIDKDILCDLPNHVASCNQGNEAGAISGSYDLGTATTAIAATSENIVDLMIDARSVLEEQNIGDDIDSENDGKGFWIVLPTWVKNRALKDIRLSDASARGSQSSLVSGKIGMIDDLNVIQSNNLPMINEGSSAYWEIPFGHVCGTTFVNEMTKNDTLTSESTFGTLHRGLQVYDWKVLYPNALGVIRVKR